MQVRLSHTLDRLPDDIREHSREVTRVAARAVRDTAKDGNKMARRLARRSGGSHAKDYFRYFSAERTGRFEWEWGPTPEGQGNLAPILEHGSINNPPHHDLAQSADQHGAEDLLRRLKRDLGPILR